VAVSPVLLRDVQGDAAPGRERPLLAAAAVHRLRRAGLL
jgi:hypothetical protein